MFELCGFVGAVVVLVSACCAKRTHPTGKYWDQEQD